MIPFVDLKTQYQSIKDEVTKAIEGVLDKTNFILGDAVFEFEQKFAAYCDSKYAVGVASGTDALHLAVKALGIGPGDEVITAANTFVATVLGISYAGARPVLVDIDADTYNIDVEKTEAAVTPKTKAIIPVHLYGRPAEMGKLTALAERYNLKIIEDAAQAHGALYRGRKTGSFGIMGCFSFYPAKNLGACGDGGAIVTSSKELYEKLKMMRNYGSPKKYYHDFIGYNSRLDTLQAAILNVKLKYLDVWNKARFYNAQEYNKKLAGVGDLVLPDINGCDSHVFHLYVLRTEKRDALMKHLIDNAVGCVIHYPVPIYSLGAYQWLGCRPQEFPVTESFSRQILSLPMYAELKEEQIDRVAELIRDFYKEGHD